MLQKLRVLKTASVRDQVFISYRRSDTEGYAGRLEDTLRGYFGEKRVFRDIGGIAPGEDFRKKSEESAERAGALIVLIGPNWLSCRTGEKPRLHEPGDLVATEIKVALDRKCVIVPVLVQGADMPREDDLPDSLKELARRNAVSVSDANWASDTTRLAKVLAIDVRSAVERKLDWLKLAVISFLVIPMFFSLLMIATPEFRDKAIRTATDSECYTFKITNSSLYKFNNDVREKLKTSRAKLEDFKSNGDVSKRDLPENATLKELFGSMKITDDETIRKIVDCCAWTVEEQKKAETQGIAAINPFCIFLVALLLGLTRAWIDPSKRKFVWAAIAVGCVGVTGTFFYYLRNVENSFPCFPSDEYFTFLATGIIITIMLGLLALSGFKPNDSIR